MGPGPRAQGCGTEVKSYSQIQVGEARGDLPTVQVGLQRLRSRKVNQISNLTTAKDCIKSCSRTHAEENKRAGAGGG